MKNRLWSLLLSITLCGTISAQLPAKVLPRFTFLKLSDDKQFTEKDLPKMKKLFFVFFDPECEHCQHAIEHLGKQYGYFKKAAVYLVSMEDPDKVKHFMETYGKDLKSRPNLIVLQDRYIQFLPTFRPKKYPSMFLYSPEKKLILYDDDEGSMFKFFKPLNG